MGETLPKFKYGAPIERKPSTIPQPFNLAPSAPKPLPPPPPEVLYYLRSVVNPDPHHFGNQDPHPYIKKSGSSSGSASYTNQDPDLHSDPHQSDKLDPDPHQFAADKPKCMEYEPI